MARSDRLIAMADAKDNNSARDELTRLADDGCPHGDDDLWLDAGGSD